MKYPIFLEDFLNKFSQLFQLAFGFALGLAFAQTNITVGWIVFWIFIYEFIFYILTAGTKYYDLLFRLSYNCLFLIAVFWGQYIYYGKTTMQDFLYPDAKKSNVKSNLNKNTMMLKLDTLFNPILEEEEKKTKRKKLKQRFMQLIK
jgi:hypothetical protein